MIGPKLDARSYAVLVLVVIGLVVSSTLVAQQFTPSSSVRSSSDATVEVAEANRQIAEALKEIARSNKEIATSIDRLSRSVGDIKDAVAEAGRQQQARATQPRATDAARATNSAAEEEEEEVEARPVFEMSR
ncbi:MAG: hypothetical protein JJU11_18350 [Candidatus Sumerlaeia bacterium]|nr:hypothetical protein [Candidatus Sumerlaeia bacterium]